MSLDHMRRFVDDYKTSPQIRELALQLTDDLPQKDFTGEAYRLFDYVQNHIRYVRDIHGVETIQTPLKTLEYSAGDCDDKATLLAALLESLGHETRFKAVGFQPGSVSHVLLEVNLPGQGWLSLDTTEPMSMGWSPPSPTTTIYR